MWRQQMTASVIFNRPIVAQRHCQTGGSRCEHDIFSYLIWALALLRRKHSGFIEDHHQLLITRPLHGEVRAPIHRLTGEPAL
ncbi:hypothetical protein A0H81_06755 [Grifola frondosa]|uniref:Uncharacterized protein n=1 Tax=Grifola frondosa TaxID=5627 RepID=A0A1C7M7U3_GRIFR|nr:hypothetical protein A0H81_06755 [Grifola frondosa]